VPEKYASLYAGRKDVVNPAFYGMITNIDENIGRLEAKLDELGIARNTILIFLTDNGSSAGCRVDQRGFVTAGYNAGMRGKKGSYYEGGHRVPCFIRWPAGGLTGPRDVKALACAKDLLPTLIDLCGLRQPLNASFDGTSLAGLLTRREESEPDRMLVVQCSQTTTPPPKWHSAVLWRSWRLVEGTELYDIAKDPGQKRDVAAANPGIVRQMRKHYERWWASVSAGFNQDSPIVIGHPRENPACLTAFDWHGNTVPWNQTSIRSGAALNGYWSVEIRQSGTYEISLRRWPQSTGLPIRGAPADGGNKLPIRLARLAIGDFERTVSVGDRDPAAVFTVELRKGKTRLRTWFLDRMGRPLCGAYYVDVRRQ